MVRTAARRIAAAKQRIESPRPAASTTSRSWGQVVQRNQHPFSPGLAVPHIARTPSNSHAGPAVAATGRYCEQALGRCGATSCCKPACRGACRQPHWIGRPSGRSPEADHPRQNNVRGRGDRRPVNGSWNLFRSRSGPGSRRQNRNAARQNATSSSTRDVPIAFAAGGSVAPGPAAEPFPPAPPPPGPRPAVSVGQRCSRCMVPTMRTCPFLSCSRPLVL